MSSDEPAAAPRLPSRAAPVKRREPRERALTRDAIAAATLKIVDAEGLDAVTMRRVAQELGTGAASLYAHVAGKEELLELIVERVIGEVEIPAEPDPDGHRQEELKAGAAGDPRRDRRATGTSRERSLRGSRSARTRSAAPNG